MMAKILLTLITLLLISPPIDIDRLKQDIENDIPYLIDFYKELHMHPEVSLMEKETSMALAKELKSIGFEVTENFGGYGVVGILKNGDGPQILYRTDMDALPMEEKTNLDYASTVEIEWNGEKTKTMHSCGHDMHMTTWLGVARAMAKSKSQWKGTLMMIGQPAEEIGQGARMMLNNGLYETFGVPDYGLGLHCNPTIPAGQIGIADGYTMANTESIDIKIYGVGAHGASPHMSIDPVVMASLMVMDIQTIVSRNVKPIEDAVVTVGAIKGGTKHNIIPDNVSLQLTVRTYKEEVRQLVHQRLREIARGIAIAHGVPEDKMPEVIVPDSFTPANYNHPELVKRISSSAAKAIGESNVIYAEPQMVGEDFACYGQTEHKVPTVLYWLGSAPAARVKSGDLPGLHSPFYYPEPETTVRTGVNANTVALMELFNKG